MPVEGFPDAARHKLCICCRKWHEPHEGTMIWPQSGFRRFRALAASLVDDTSGMRFLCERCLKTRRIREVALVSGLVLLLAAALLLMHIGVLR